MSRPLLHQFSRQFARGAYRASAAVVLAAILWFATIEAASARRVALVIGNAEYRNAARLENPSRDAKAVAEMFKKAGFDAVHVHYNLGYLKFTRALRNFEDAAANAEIAVVYYAGHGIEIGGTNYLIPVNARLARGRDARDEAVDLNRLVLSAEPAAKLRLIIIDACRDNPFSRNMKRARLVRALQRGLGAVAPTRSNTLIAYASKAGSTAEDGSGDHSPFAHALLKNLVVPGLDIRLAFGRIRDEVMKQTDNRQEPYVYGSLGGANISLVPPPSRPKAPSVASARADYDLVAQIGSKKAWEIYLKTHKSGLYADLARAQIAKLEAAGRVKTASLAPQGARPEPRLSEDLRTWDLIKDQSDPKVLREFIRRYPRSNIAPIARTRLSVLEQAAKEKRELAAAKAKEEKARLEQARLEKAKLAKSEQQKSEQQKAEMEKTFAEQRAAALKRAEAAALRRAKDEPAGADTPDSAEKPDGAAKEGEETKVASLPEQPVDVPAGKSSDVVDAEAPPEPEPNTPDLVLAAQRELERVGCFQGRPDGLMGPVTRAALGRYLSTRGEPKSGDVTAPLVEDLKDETGRVCPLVCSAGQVAKGERCIAVAKDKQPEKKKAKAPDRRRKAAKRPARSKAKQRPAPRRKAVISRPKVNPGRHAIIGIGF